MQAAVVVFPGTNRDGDAVKALTRATGKKPLLVWHGDSELPKVDLVVLPGGFSYGDYLRTGAMAAHAPIMREIAARAQKGLRVWGICNGFQILCESGLLPGILLRNAQLRFVCRTVTLAVEHNDSDYTRFCQPQQQLRVIVAHGDGNYFAAPDQLKELEDNRQIAFRYRDNPNGSIKDIAGIFNKTRNVLGMMPHPENAVEPLHGSTDGAVLFDSIAQSLAA